MRMLFLFLVLGVLALPAALMAGEVVTGAAAIIDGGTLDVGEHCVRL